MAEHSDSKKLTVGRTEEQPEVRTVEFADLAGEASRVLIKEGESVYILRRTTSGKLVLNK